MPTATLCTRLFRPRPSPSRRDFSLLDEKVGANRPPDRMLHALLQRDEIGAAESIVVVAAQQALAVEVGAAHRRLEIKRHLAAGASGRTGGKQPEAGGPFEIARVGHRWTLRRSHRLETRVRPVGVLRTGRRHRAVERHLVLQVDRPSMEGRMRILGRDELLEIDEIVQAEPAVEQRRLQPESLLRTARTSAAPTVRACALSMFRKRPLTAPISDGRRPRIAATRVSG